MLIRDFRRFSLVLGSAILLLLLCVRLVGPAGTETLLGLQVGDWSGGSPTSPHAPSYTSPFAVASPSALEAAMQQSALTDSAKDNEVPFVSSPSRPSGSRFIGPNGEIVGFQPPAEVRPGGSGILHTEIFSVTTKDRQYFPIRMGSSKVLNPNIIPHPRLESAWIVVAQKQGGVNDDDQQQQGLFVEPSIELVCNAMFIDDALTCIGADGRGFGEPTTLPVQPTAGDGTKCTGDLEFFNLNVGPHDARVFYGPRNPYTIYGSNSNFNCFGQWVRDFRGLITDWGVDVGSAAAAGASFTEEFASPAGTELQRPPPYGAVEKNWFIFWDTDNVHYVHYDVAPRRAFARLNSDGSAGEDLGRHTSGRDDACLARYLPALAHAATQKQQDQVGGSPAAHESIHQATNSLAVTLCRRSDPGCVPDDTNTFIFAVLHHKAYRDFHSVYEPYVMVFRQRAPFEMFAVSSKPLWISGRGTVRGTGGRPDTTEMFYVTSIAWKNKGLKYHGYVDDVLFLAFGIEDERAAGIDVQAGSLLANLGLCEEGFADGGV
ncbi:hypothetical protein J7T55_015469 [Diaporthe amygdali]|uniref:uncharacterized protein n=1 Tax=Phomopsis amygdali TaxID=1214568 RepID=UPI0022FEC894|nr:uncharacterized protein J7T55_015469 [Diaporthe amygdali]KAJ0120737.1 hypothetical protein J7T55_015469 [Diaporthe amygdali]